MTIRGRLLLEAKTGTIAVVAALLLASCSGSEQASDPDLEATTADATEVDTGETDEPNDEANSSSAEWEEIVAAAEAEGTVMWYTTWPGTGEAIEPAFEAKYPGIDLEFVRAGGSETMPRLDQEREMGGSGGADAVLVSDSGWLVERSEAGELLDVKGPSFEAWEGLDDFFYGDWFVGTMAPYQMIYNTNLVDEPPTGLADLARPENDGALAFGDPSSDNHAMLWAKLMEEFDDDFMNTLASYNPQFTDSVVPMGQAVAAGEAAMGWPTIAIISQGLIEEGAPVAVVFPEEFTFAGLGAAAALGWAEHPNAALVLVDFLASEEGQTLINEHGISPIGAPGTVDLAIEYDDIAWTHEWSQERLAEVRAEWNSYFR